MNIPGFEWTIIQHGGQRISNEEANWRDISVIRAAGERQVFSLPYPAASLEVRVLGRKYTLRAPDMHTYFFRENRSRISLGGEAELMYFGVGYVCLSGKVWLEIDPRGNSQLRFSPITEESV